MNKDLMIPRGPGADGKRSTDLQQTAADFPLRWFAHRVRNVLKQQPMYRIWVTADGSGAWRAVDGLDLDSSRGIGWTTADVSDRGNSRRIGPG